MGLIYRGGIWHVRESTTGPNDPASCFGAIPSGGISVNDDGRIEAAGLATDLQKQYPAYQIIDFGDSIIMPGWIDGHLHYPQLDIIGSYGEKLIGWLNRYTFPAESGFADPETAAANASRLITELLAHGTTTGAIFFIHTQVGDGDPLPGNPGPWIPRHRRKVQHGPPRTRYHPPKSRIRCHRQRVPD